MEKDILEQSDLYKELGLDKINFDDLDAILAGIESHDSAAGAENKQPEQKKAKAKPVKKPEKEKKDKALAEKKPDEKQQKGGKPSVLGVIALTMAKTVAVVLCICMTAGLLAGIFLMSAGDAASAGGGSNVAILDKFDMFLTNQISSALDGVLNLEKVYWLNDGDMVAPKADPDNYGHAATPGELAWLLEEAADLIGDQKMVFNENTPIWEEKGVEYYYDETILVITWKQVINRVVYNMSEVRIAHGSQFRRFLAGGEFGSDKQYVTTDMAASVNAVVATSGDFYKYRRNGAVVYQGQLRRFEGEKVDSCFINEDGDLLFAYRGELKTEEEAVRFIQDNNVRFSLAFGPVLVDNGVACAPSSYPLGEINDRYARAALCQVDQLHYLLVTACGEKSYQNRHTISEFANNLESFGVQKAYALDGGQTTVIAMDGKLYNDVEFGYQRQISDIIYFATALPEGE